MAENKAQENRTIDQTRLAALYKVSHTLGSSLDLDDVLKQAMDAVIELSGAERGFLVLVDPETQKFSIQAARNIEHDSLSQDENEAGPAKISFSVIRTTLAQGEGIISTNAQHDPRFAKAESVILHDLRSIMCTPLRWRGENIGAIYVDNRIRSGIFTPSDLEILSALAAQAAAAIANARLYAQVDQNLASRITELEMLAHIDQELNTDLDFNHVVTTTLHWALQGTAAKDGWLALFEQEKPPPAEPELKIVAGRGTGQYIDSRNPLIEKTLTQVKTGEKKNPKPLATSKPDLPLQEIRPTSLTLPLLIAGKPIGLLAVERDPGFSETDANFLKRLITHAAIAIDNAHLYQEVQAANQAKSKFVSVVVHELRIPMTSIKGYADLIRQGAVGPVTDMQTNFLDVIRNNVDRMAALVSDLSDIARIESGRLKLEPSQTSLQTLVDEVVRGLSHEIEAKNQVLKIDIPDHLPTIYADPQRVVQILTNLISNAWKYTPAEGKIQLRAFLQGAMIRIEVEDNGIGISPEDEKKLFTQFFRSENPTVSEQPGWGLGLNVTRSLVEMMNGKIGVQSTAGDGSLFWFTLPAQAQ